MAAVDARLLFALLAHYFLCVVNLAVELCFKVLHYLLLQRYGLGRLDVDNYFAGVFLVDVTAGKQVVGLEVHLEELEDLALLVKLLIDCLLTGAACGV